MSRKSIRPAIFLVAGLLSLMTSGCGGNTPSITPENPDAGIALDQFGEVYRVVSIKKGRPPTSLAEIEPMKNFGLAGYEAAKSGNLLISWGAKLPDTGEEPGVVASPEILAYPKIAPEQGGYILMLDRTIKKMTADEFKAAPKAGK